MTVFRVIFLTILSIVILNACANKEMRRPTVYRGGQYYGDAIHSEDLGR